MTTEEERFNEAQARAHDLGLRIYSRRPDEDITIAFWWEYVFRNGELPNITCRGTRPLSGFFNMFRAPHILIYSRFADEDMIEFAGWFCKADIADKGFYYSNWAHPSIRGTRRQVALSAAVYDGAFFFADVLVGITKQKNLLPIHTKLGYTYGCAVPYFFDSEPAYIVYLTEKTYKSSRFFAVAHKENTHGRRRRKERKQPEISEPRNTTRNMELSAEYGRAV